MGCGLRAVTLGLLMLAVACAHGPHAHYLKPTLTPSPAKVHPPKAERDPFVDSIQEAR